LALRHRLLVHLLVLGFVHLDDLAVGHDAIAVVRVAPAHLAGLLEDHLALGVLALVVGLHLVALLEAGLEVLGLVVELLHALGDLVALGSP
jgi:hypothetical protein